MEQVDVSHEDIQKVRRWECSQNGHTFSELVTFGSADPVSIYCTNCGESWPLMSKEVKDLLRDILDGFVPGSKAHAYERLREIFYPKT